MSTIIYLSIPAFIVTMVIEALWLRREQRVGRATGLRGYQRADTRQSLLLGIGNVIISAGTKLLAVAAMTWLHHHRLLDAGTGVAAWVMLFFAEDLCYYLFHRTSHEVRLFWAAHENHHSSTYYNLSTALRQSWTTPLTSPIFWMPLPLLGFAPWMVLTQQAISLLYQYWLHTETIRTLGPLEWVLNTPSHHRVHHGRDPQYLDRNHAGILIIWDRLFGSFEPERVRPDYGLTKNLERPGLVHAAFHEFAAIARDVRGARSLHDALAYVFGPPGWSPDGSRQTSEQMRAEAGLR
jgi:sterol desaturase/sphingolipid hydroxylase (fatty acid hydroxylase superfamily)